MSSLLDAYVFGNVNTKTFVIPNSWRIPKDFQKRDYLKISPFFFAIPWYFSKISKLRKLKIDFISTLRHKGGADAGLLYSLCQENTLLSLRFAIHSYFDVFLPKKSRQFIIEHQPNLGATDWSCMWPLDGNCWNAAIVEKKDRQNHRIDNHRIKHILENHWTRGS